MCRFKSGIQLKHRNVLAPIENESHSDLLKSMKIEDSIHNASRKFVRAELIPPNENIAANIEEWEYKVDQDIVPEWFEIDKEKYEKSFREDVKCWLKENLNIEYVGGKSWTYVKDGEYTYHFMYGSLFKSKFGKNNNYAESDVRENLVKNDLLNSIKEKYGFKLLPIELNLTSLNGSKEYGILKGDEIAIPTIDILRKYKENIPLINGWYWTSTANGTNITGDASDVRLVLYDGGVYYDGCIWNVCSVRPFFITKS